MKMFKATDYLKYVDNATLAVVIQFWEDWRGADGEEDVYNLQCNDDFKLFVDKYGIEKTIEFYNKGQYYLDGNAFHKPCQLTHDYMLRFINDVYDLEFFKQVEKSLVCFEEWFNTNAIKKLINPNKFRLTIDVLTKLDKDEVKEKLQVFCLKNDISAVFAFDDDIE